MGSPGTEKEGEIVEEGGGSSVFTVPDGNRLVMRDEGRVIAFQHDGDTVPTRVGSVVRLEIAAGVHRPLLVHTIEPAGTLAGELFLNWEEDMKAAWVREHCFYPPDLEHRTIAVKRVRRGTAVGEWEPIQ